MTDSPFMLIKLLLVVGLGAAFVWWQLRDAAGDSARDAERDLDDGLSDDLKSENKQLAALERPAALPKDLI